MQYNDQIDTKFPYQVKTLSDENKISVEFNLQIRRLFSFILIAID